MNFNFNAYYSNPGAYSPFTNAGMPRSNESHGHDVNQPIQFPQVVTDVGQQAGFEPSEHQSGFSYDMLSESISRSVQCGAYLSNDFSEEISALDACIDRTDFSREFHDYSYGEDTSMLRLFDLLAGLAGAWSHFRLVPGFANTFVSRFNPILEKLKTTVLQERQEELQGMSQRNRMASVLEMENYYSAPYNQQWLNVLKLYLNIGSGYSYFSSDRRRPTTQEQIAVKFLEVLYAYKGQNEQIDDVDMLDDDSSLSPNSDSSGSVVGWAAPSLSNYHIAEFSFNDNEGGSSHGVMKQSNSGIQIPFASETIDEDDDVDDCRSVCDSCISTSQ